MKFTDQEGKEWEFRGEYRPYERGDYVLDRGGNLDHVDFYPVESRSELAIVHPVPKRHTFGGVVFEETGEMRAVHHDEWVLTSSGQIMPGNFFPSAEPQTILRPVALEG